MIAKQSDSFTYHGEVNLALKVKDKIISIFTHNDGTDILFQNLVIALVTGKFSATPAFIGLYEAAAVDGSYTLKGKTALTEKTFLNQSLNQSVVWIARFGTILSHNQLGDIDSDKYYRFYLLDTSNRQLAYVQSNPTELEKVGAGVSALVEWNMFFSNGNSNLAEFDNITSNITSE